MVVLVGGLAAVETLGEAVIERDIAIFGCHGEGWADECAVYGNGILRVLLHDFASQSNRIRIVGAAQDLEQTCPQGLLLIGVTGPRIPSDLFCQSSELLAYECRITGAFIGSR